MVRPVTVVSALSFLCLAATNFLKLISQHNQSMQLQGICDISPVIEKNSLVILLVPILGDNDLLPKLENAISAFLHKVNGLAGCHVTVILKGDRHISDNLVETTDPIYARLTCLLGHLKSLRISKIKLDLETFDGLARDTILEIESHQDICTEIEEMAYLLGSSPYWDIDGRLDFFDVCSGRSLLYNQSAQTIRRVAQLTKFVGPRTLILRHAYLDNGSCLALLNESEAVNIDLGSNRIYPEKLLKDQLKSCNWLSLAANDLDDIDFHMLPASLTQLRLDKNRLQHVSLEGLTNQSIRWLSLYRNSIRQIECLPSTIDYLNLGANPLVKIPESLYDTRIQWLGLARTKLTSLPNWLTEMPSLQTLDISYIEDQLPRSQIDHLISQNKRLITRPGFFYG